MNTIQLIGRLTADPELKQINTAKGAMSVANFSLAVDRAGAKDKDGNNVVDFIRCSAWDKKAEIISQYVTKGQQLAISGSLQQDSWVKDGVKQTTYQVSVRDVTFVAPRQDKKGTSTGMAAVTPATTTARSQEEIDLDALLD